MKRLASVRFFLLTSHFIYENEYSWKRFALDLPLAFIAKIFLTGDNGQIRGGGGGGAPTPPLSSAKM